MNHLITIFMSFLIVMTMGCAETTVEQSPQSETPKEVAKEVTSMSSEASQKIVEGHLNAFGANDLDVIMADYTEESIIFTPDATLTGLTEIRALFAGMFPAFPAGETTFTLDKIQANNEIVYIVWHADAPTVEVPLGTDTFIMENGKIKRQTFTAVINSKTAE